MNQDKAYQDLKTLNVPSLGNICYGDGYYANSLVQRYGMSISDLERLVGYNKRRATEQLEEAKAQLDKLEDEDKFENMSRDELLEHIRKGRNMKFLVQQWNVYDQMSGWTMVGPVYSDSAGAEEEAHKRACENPGNMYRAVASYELSRFGPYGDMV